VKLRRTAALATVATTAALTLTACGSPRTVHDQAALSFSGTRLIIDTESDLQLVPGTGHGIRVQRWVSGTAASPGHASWTLTGDTLRLSIDCTGLVFHCGSRFQAAIPSRTALVIHAGDNHVTVSGLSGPVVIDGGAGQVQLSGISGSLQVSTGSGSITASAIRCPVVLATSSAGNISVSFAAAPERADVASTDGNATISVPVAGNRYHVVLAASSGTARSQVPDDPGSGRIIHLSSGSGNVTVRRGG
jgi:hypothetical protein